MSCFFAKKHHISTVRMLVAMAVSHTLQSSPFIHMHTMIMGVLETEVDSGKAVGREEERERESGENHKEPIYGNKVALARSISECMCVCVCVCSPSISSREMSVHNKKKDTIWSRVVACSRVPPLQFLAMILKVSASYKKAAQGVYSLDKNV